MYLIISGLLKICQYYIRALRIIIILYCLGNIDEKNVSVCSVQVQFLKIRYLSIYLFIIPGLFSR